MTTDVSPSISVFVVDDHELVRRGVVDLLSSYRDLTVAGEAGSAAEALRRIPAARPDVVLLDVRLPDDSGIAVCRSLRSELPGLRCLMLTSYDDDEALYASVMAGAAGYLLKQVGGSSLVDAIRTVAAGRSLIDPGLVDKLLSRVRGAAERLERSSPLDALTSREREVLDLIAGGHTNAEIGRQLFLAEKTVKNHVTSILTKLNLQRRTQAAVLSTRLRDRPQP